jgi:hypothetical protein
MTQLQDLSTALAGLVASSAQRHRCPVSPLAFERLRLAARAYRHRR